MLDKLGFHPIKEGRQELPGLIFQSMIDLLLMLDKLGFPPRKQGETEAA